MSVIPLDSDATLEHLHIIIERAEKSFPLFKDLADDPQLIDFPSLVLYVHLYQMARGIQLLLSNQHTRPAIPVLRSMLEACLSVHYIHKENYEDRSLAWICGHFREQVRLQQLADPESQRGKELNELAKREIIGGPIGKGRRAVEARAGIEGIMQKLKNPPLLRLDTTFSSLKKELRREPKWHSLFGGPKNIYELAESVELACIYRVYYEHWSSVIHGTECQSLLSSQPGADSDFGEITSYGWYRPDLIIGLTVLFIEQASALMVKRFSPREK
jgi:hypothetical protein